MPHSGSVRAALVREVESRAALLRSRTASLDKAVAAEREARQAAQEQVGVRGKAWQVWQGQIATSAQYRRRRSKWA